MVLWRRQGGRVGLRRGGNGESAARWAVEEADDLISFAGTKMRGGNRGNCLGKESKFSIRSA